MNSDLVMASVVGGALWGVSWVAGRRTGSHLRRLRMPLFGVLIVLTSLYASAWVGRVENVWLFPLGTAILLSNLTPALTCFLAGMAWQIPGVPTGRKVVGLGTLVILSVLFFFAPVLRPIWRPVHVSDQGWWKNGVCMQSHEASCGAAAAVTMLTQFGIEATERELVAECLTSRAGTEPLALYRALARRGQAHSLQPRLAASDPRQWRDAGQFPVLAMVGAVDAGMPGETRTGRLRQLLGRANGGHAVVVLGVNGRGDYLVADPGEGLARWSPYIMSMFYNGQAFYLSADAERAD